VIRLWLAGMFVQRSGRLLGAAAGVALTVALLASIGAFIVSSSATMTERAVASLPVDWQVQLVPGTDPYAIMTAIGLAAAPRVSQIVGYADTAGFEAETGGTVQTTGPGKALGIDARYRHEFPAQMRPLSGASDGVLVAQQTAANLHATVGDDITVQRLGLPPVQLRIAGVIDLPNADSMFQAVGVPAGTAPQAPPDNVVVMSMADWHELFDPQLLTRPDSLRLQLHVGLAHDTLPRDPEAAYAHVLRVARNVEARIAGSAIVGNNLAARLDGVREDALYAKMLFLFLGLPGAIVAVLLTVAVAASGGARRRREQALLRTRGASSFQIFQLAGIEAIGVGIGGVLLGFLATEVLSLALLEAHDLNRSTLPWLAGAGAAGLLLAMAAIMFPAWADSRRVTVAATKSIVGRRRSLLWQRLYLDLVLLAISAAAFWLAASTGYQIVLAPEGVAVSSVDYQAFIAPLFLWVGTGLLSVRLWGIGLDRGRKSISWMLGPLARSLSGVVAASLSRQQDRMTHGAGLVLLAFAFATSTAVFNTTYNAQSRVDAELTNGADVTVTGTAAAPPTSKLAELKALPGVIAAQPMQHRFAYVGADLQDLYGIDPAHIREATNMSDAYFQGGDAEATLAALGNTPDGVLVSEETVTDFQLQPGDQINLRLQSAVDHQYHPIPFRFVGVAREFPTAPRDSFLVANAVYVAEKTGSAAAEIVLLRTAGDPNLVAGRVRNVVGSLAGANVTDIGSSQRLISSSLTAVDLRGLTRLELGFAVLMVTGAAGVVLALGLAERRRTYAILVALGATNRELGAFLWSEGLLIFVGGASIGLLAGFGVAQMLVKILTGVFDPPPEHLTVPWAYLTMLVVAALTAMSAALAVSHVTSRKSAIETIRES
jgi:putative ABC transport system permease protein